MTLTCFLVQVATGFAMTFYYRPTVAEAFSSVEYMMTQVNFGAQLFVVRTLLLVTHLRSIFDIQ